MTDSRTSAGRLPPPPPPPYRPGPRTHAAPAAPYVLVPPKTSGKAIAALVCSILNFLIGPVVLAMIGLLLAVWAKRDIRSSGGTIGGERVATTATVLSIVGLILDGVALLVIALIVSATHH